MVSDKLHNPETPSAGHKRYNFGFIQKWLYKIQGLFKDRKDSQFSRTEHLISKILTETSQIFALIWYNGIVILSTDTILF